MGSFCTKNILYSLNSSLGTLSHPVDKRIRRIDENVRKFSIVKSSEKYNKISIQ